MREEDCVVNLELNLARSSSSMPCMSARRAPGTVVRPGGVDNPVHEHDLRGVAAGRPLQPHVDLRVSPHRRQALERVVVDEPPELQEVVERRAHPAAERVLVVALALGEGVVMRVLLDLDDENGDGAHPEHVELVLAGAKGGVKVLHARVTPKDADLENVVGADGGAGAGDGGSHGFEDVRGL